MSSVFHNFVFTFSFSFFERGFIEVGNRFPQKHEETERDRPDRKNASYDVRFDIDLVTSVPADTGQKFDEDGGAVSNVVAETPPHDDLYTGDLYAPPNMDFDHIFNTLKAATPIVFLDIDGVVLGH